MNDKFSDIKHSSGGETCLPLPPSKPKTEQIPLEIYQKRNMSRLEIKAFIRTMRKNPALKILSIYIRKTGERQ